MACSDPQRDWVERLYQLATGRSCLFGPDFANSAVEEAVDVVDVAVGEILVELAFTGDPSDMLATLAGMARLHRRRDGR